MFDDFLPITIGFYTDFWRYQDEVNRLYHLFFPGRCGRPQILAAYDFKVARIIGALMKFICIINIDFYFGILFWTILVFRPMIVASEAK